MTDEEMYDLKVGGDTFVPAGIDEGFLIHRPEGRISSRRNH